MSRVRILRAGFMAGVSIGALAFTFACTPVEPIHSGDQSGYVLCNSDGCGDNVTYVLDKD